MPTTPATLHSEVDDVLDRLGDKANVVWTRDEIELAYKDGYNIFCGETKCLFDYWVLENLPVTGNWQTDLERYLMEQKVGRSLTDQPFGYTADHEKNQGVGGKYGGHKGVGPTPGTAVSDKAHYAAGVTRTAALPQTVPGGDLPHSTVAVSDVYYDRRRLVHETTAHLKRIDPNYENRSGDPEMYTWDKDGLYFMRVVPQASGGATYVTVNGQRGRNKQTDDGSTVVAASVGGKTNGGFGVLRYEEGGFPAGGPWGSPTRMHPHTENIDVEIFRLGRDLDSHVVELPDAYKKYVTFYAMAKALERPGHGQDLEMSAHYMERFAMGIRRMTRKSEDMSQEYVGKLGGGGEVGPSFGLGDPQTPLYDWGMTAPS
jgi:hypothetical protein